MYLPWDNRLKQGSLSKKRHGSKNYFPQSKRKKIMQVYWKTGVNIHLLIENIVNLPINATCVDSRVEVSIKCPW